MIKKLASAVGLMIAMTFAVVFGGSPAALADVSIQGDTVECVSVGGYNRGCMTHIDAGDDFEVCDQRVDQQSVYGAVQEYSNGSWVRRGYEFDGADPGCNYFHFDVTEADYDKYRLKVCWKDYCEYDYFRE